ncbi:AraC family transcriptional regulator [Brevibacillus formosus]|uniref:AraC family transcriptional regulator n=1 Tax=Brevibacillus formosus TaxID=54913 RepID=A0A837KFP7_9BACL|nr:AraC family transcriptional regulator [Brevibacillus formosus]KLH96015.1 AraC family transcriptional regulator [Brevibacillus formosus]MED1958513.1 AraC family transcriptional regulator [Brevibacillus formosus]PSJ93147.1 AraC family transcriptional regulator [Brevibacillus formosus]GED61035.1 HTH-type transcriptional activator Btr [Brevibacillus formosus]
MNETQALVQQFTEKTMAETIFKLRDITWLKAQGHDRLRQQFTHSHILLVVTGGRGRLRLENEEYQLRQDAIYVCPPMLTFGIVPDSADHLEMYMLRFDVFMETRDRHRRFQALREKDLFPFRGEISVQSAGQLPVYCDLIQNLWKQETALERFRGQHTFQELWYHIVKHAHFSATDSGMALERARAHMEEHYSENVTIEQLARIAEVSPKYFVDLFKKTYGISAMDYLAELRISRAKQMMVQSHAKLRDIAHQVGYNDEFYFSRKFKKAVGVSPTLYMKSRQRKIAAYGSTIIGHLLALKMIPYAAPLHPKWTAYYHHSYRNDIPVHLSAFRINQNWKANIELLRDAKPDVIIGLDETSLQEQKQLNEIAPTLYVPFEERGWKEQLQLMADFLGESMEAHHWLCEYEKKVKRARAKLQHVLGDETVLIVRVLKNQLYVHCNRSMNEVFYQDLQVKPAFVSEQKEYDQLVTVQELIALAPDRLLLLVCQEAETLACFQALKESGPWQEIEAVRNNRAHVIMSDPWREYSATAHERIVEESVRLFSGDRPC